MSSYSNSLSYLDLISSVTHVHAPKHIVEFGILEGHSLRTLAQSAPNAQIEAYDIFDEFNGNHAEANIDLTNDEGTRGLYDNVKIAYGNFYDMHALYADNSIDLLHVDIANNGDVYAFCIGNYLPKVRPGGVIILEGGSVARDNIEWMVKYNKTPIAPYLNTLKKAGYHVATYGKVPSITLIQLNNDESLL